MTKLTLLLRNLRYFRGVNIAVVLGMAVATAVLTGALMVGDSVRGSLADLALRRLGPVDYALISTRFFDQSLAHRVNGDNAGNIMGVVAPAMIVPGGAATKNGDTRTADVQIAAMGAPAQGLQPIGGPELLLSRDAAIVNGELGRALGLAAPGAGISLSVPTQSDSPRESALARRGLSDVLSQVTASVTRIEAEPDFISLFNPNGTQRVSRNAWVNLKDLQDATEQPGRVNALLVNASLGHRQTPHDAGIYTGTLNDRLRKVIRLDDYGLSVTPVGNNEASVFARETYIHPAAVDAAGRAATALHIPLRKVSVNLVNDVTNLSAESASRVRLVVDRDKASRLGIAIPDIDNALDHAFSQPPITTQSIQTSQYRVIVEAPNLRKTPEALKSIYVRTRVNGVSGLVPLSEVAHFEPSATTSQAPESALHKGEAVIHYAVAAGISSLDEGTLADGEIAINQWTADHLGAKVGDKLRIDFYQRQPGGNLTVASKALPSEQLTFTVKYILPMTGLGGDAKLPPNYKGLTDAKSVADWDPPEGLTINKKLVTKEDEKYWDTWRAAPKLFVNFETARKFWGGVYGDVTGLRVPMKDADRFSKKLLGEIDPQSMSMVFRPIKAEQLAAAGGGTDFGEFFLMFSFFLIVAAALLVAMLFRLNVEQRARQLGLMSAVGFSPAVLRRLALGEGMILALVGSVIGLAGALGYTSLIMYGLRTWWVGAVGTTAMTLHLVPLTLVYGWVGSLFVAIFAILWAVWRIGKAQPASLLAGGWGTEIRRRGDGRWLRWCGIGAIAIGMVLVAVSLMGTIDTLAGFGGGGLILCGCLTWLAAQLRPRRHPGASFAGGGSLTRLGIRNATRHTARGVLAVGLIGIAAFALITVAALKEKGVKDPDNRQSGTGGYRLILTAGIPLSMDLNTAEGRKLVGMKPDEANDPIFNNAHFTMLRRWAGQDISCLNLTRPNSPTILGLPPEMIGRGGFVAGKDNDLWKLLESPRDSNPDAPIPVIVDGDTAEYVLKISQGDIITITDALNIPRKLKLVATISHSIFQGQLLMSDANFRLLFPAQSGFGMALIEPREKTAGWDENAVAKRLSSALADYSVSVDTTTSRLQTYQEVQNTYLDTFQTLGALGLMLGTLGLAVVLVRTVIERKSELALLASLGFASDARVKLVLAENAFLLILGLFVGAASAVIGILPTVLRDARPLNVAMLAVTLGIVLVVGLFSSAVAVALSGVHVAPADLRRE
jgi:ABC-type antimicrobial peptide transport system permease subunit